MGSLQEGRPDSELDNPPTPQTRFALAGVPPNAPLMPTVDWSRGLLPTLYLTSARSCVSRSSPTVEQPPVETTFKFPTSSQPSKVFMPLFLRGLENA